MATSENLQEAFAGESQANRKYLAFAKKAEQEGFPQVARLFRAAADAETVHAHGHLRAMKGVGDTKTNVQAAIEGEGFEFQQMYPKFLKEAEDENAAGAAIMFRYALAVEEIHHDLYAKALEALKKGGDLPVRKIYVCQVCGNTVYDEVPDACPVCNSAGKMFREVG